MAMRLESENVRYIVMKILSEMDMWTADGKDAEKTLAYINGVYDTAEAVIQKIKDLGGR